MPGMLATNTELRDDKIRCLHQRCLPIVGEFDHKWGMLMRNHALCKGAHYCEALVIRVDEGDFGDPQIIGTHDESVDEFGCVCAGTTDNNNMHGLSIS
jgi:hypothetical protein